MTLRPFTLTPVLVPKPWGGRRLAEFGKRLPPDKLIGESWDVADLDPASTTVPDPATRVASGPLTGATLAEVIADHQKGLLGGTRPAPGGRFPLLVKLLDARESLSVQVHPPASYVADHPDAHLKTESWVVIDAEPGAQLLLGVVDGTTLDELAAVLGTPDMLPLLRRVRATPGNVHHLPAGLIHALGAGVLVAEVQTPSDTTYRLYDWVEEYGREPRELHREAGLACLEHEWATNLAPPHRAQRPDGVLLDTEHYRLARHRFTSAHNLASPAGRARIVLVIEGSTSIDGLGPLGPGGVALLPAAWSGELATPTSAAVLVMSP